MSWVAAVKEWNAGRGSWSLPKKDTTEYDEVRKIQARIKESAAAAPKNEIVEDKPKAERKVRKQISSDEKRVQRAAPKKAPEEATEPTKPDESKTRIVSKSAVARSIVDVDERRRSAEVSAAAPALKPKTKPAGEPLKAKSKEDRAAEKEKKKSVKVEIIDTRGQLAKAKLEKNAEAVSSLSQKIKELKISLL
jgi:hypothetical protein